MWCNCIVLPFFLWVWLRLSLFSLSWDVFIPNWKVRWRCLHMETTQKKHWLMFVFNSLGLDCCLFHCCQFGLIVLILITHCIHFYQSNPKGESLPHTHFIVYLYKFFHTSLTKNEFPTNKYFEALYIRMYKYIYIYVFHINIEVYVDVQISKKWRSLGYLLVMVYIFFHA